MRYIVILLLLAACSSPEKRVHQPAQERSGKSPFPQAELEEIGRKAPPQDPSDPASKGSRYNRSGAYASAPVVTAPEDPQRPVIWAYLDGRSRHEGWRWWMRIDYAGWVTNGASPTGPRIPVQRITVELIGTACYTPQSETGTNNVTDVSAFHEITTHGAPAWSCTPEESCSRTCADISGMNICTPLACGRW